MYVHVCDESWLRENLTSEIFYWLKYPDLQYLWISSYNGRTNLIHPVTMGDNIWETESGLGMRLRKDLVHSVDILSNRLGTTRYTQTPLANQRQALSGY